MLICEQIHLDCTPTRFKYNFARFEEPSTGFKHSEESKKKLALAREARKLKGITISKETRIRMSEDRLSISVKYLAKIKAATVAATGYPLKLTTQEKGISFEALSIRQAVTSLAKYGTKTNHTTLQTYAMRSDKKLLKGWAVELIPRKGSYEVPMSESAKVRMASLNISVEARLNKSTEARAKIKAAGVKACGFPLKLTNKEKEGGGWR